MWCNVVGRNEKNYRGSRGNSFFFRLHPFSVLKAHCATLAIINQKCEIYSSLKYWGGVPETSLAQTSAIHPFNIPIKLSHMRMKFEYFQQHIDILPQFSSLSLFSLLFVAFFTLWCEHIERFFTLLYLSSDDDKDGR
jgi:hypothetical protein